MKRGDYINNAIQGQRGYILRMGGGWRPMTYDVIVNGEAIVTCFNIGEAKEFCLANKLGTKVSNYRIEHY